MNHIDIPVSILLPAVVAIVVAIISSAGTWFLVKPQRAKTTAEAADVLTGAALNLVKQLQLQIAELEKDVEALQHSVERQRDRIRVVTKLNARLLQGASLLVTQLVESGQEPVWRIECDVAGDEELAAELVRLGNSKE